MIVSLKAKMNKKNIFQKKSPPDVRSILSEIPKNDIEEDSKPTANESADDQVKTSSSRPTITHSHIIAIDDFFFYNIHDSQDQPLPDHVLEQSPCNLIIGVNNDYKIPFYYCKLHPEVENANLESVEHHCRYKDPELHKDEILRLLNEEEEENNNNSNRQQSEV